MCRAERKLATSQGMMSHKKLEEVGSRFPSKASTGSVALPTPQFRTSGLQNSKRISVVLSYNIWSNLLQQPQEPNTDFGTRK